MANAIAIRDLPKTRWLRQYYTRRFISVIFQHMKIKPMDLSRSVLDVRTREANKRDNMATIRRLTFLVLITVVIGSSTTVNAKCGFLFVTVEGESRSSGRLQEVLVRIYPERSKRYSEEKATPQEGHFRVDVTFSTFVSASWFGSHNCSRRPARVVVILMENGSERESLEFSIHNDFTWDERAGRWTIKSPVIFKDRPTTPTH
jgi:hypothetical protein